MKLFNPYTTRCAAIFLICTWFPAVHVDANEQPKLTVLVDAQGRPAAAPLFSTLQGIVTNVVIPGYAAVASRAGTLVGALDQLSSAPSTNTLTAAQLAWRDANRAWKETGPFKCGPAAELGVGSRIYNWPIRSTSVEALIRGNKPIDDSLLNAVGVSVTGLGTIEYLLFDAAGNDTSILAALTGAQGERRRNYLKWVGTDVFRKATELEQAFRTGDPDFRAHFATAGQESMNFLVNQLIEGIEIGTVEGLQRMVQLHAGKKLRAGQTEGGLSRSLKANVFAVIQGAHRLFDGNGGPGIAEHLKRVNPTLVDSIEAQFQHTLKTIEALDQPLESILDERPAVISYLEQQIKALELLVKVDMVSSLGVTLTFGSSDGD